MHRRGFLLATGLATSGLAAASVPSLDAAHAARSGDGRRPAVPFQLTVAGAGGLGWQCDQARRFAAHVEALAQASIAVEIVGPAAAGSESFRFMDATALCDIDPALGFVAGLPGRAALSPLLLESWLAAGGGQTQVDAIAARHGLKLLLAAHTGIEPLLWSGHPVRTVADLAGTPIAAAGLARRVVAGLGAQALTLDDTGALPRLGDGGPAAVETSALIAQSNGLLQASTYAAGPAFTPNGNTVALAIPLEVWQNLSHSAQAIVSAAAAQTYRDSVAEDSMLRPLIKPALQARAGLTVERLSASLSSAIETVARVVVAELAASSPSASRINASYMAFRESSGLARDGGAGILS